MKWIIKKNTWSSYADRGWGNGYALIPIGHFLHGKHYDEIDVEVHGGLTYSELITNWHCEKWGVDRSDIGMWCVGFDTAHYGDTPDNWTEDDVRKHTEELAANLDAMKEDDK